MRRFSEKYDLNGDNGKKPWWYVAWYTIAEWLEDLFKTVKFDVKWYFTSDEMKKIWLHRLIIVIIIVVIVLSVKLKQII